MSEAERGLVVAGIVRYVVAAVALSALVFGALPGSEPASPNLPEISFVASPTEQPGGGSVSFDPPANPAFKSSDGTCDPGETGTFWVNAKVSATTIPPAAPDSWLEVWFPSRAQPGAFPVMLGAWNLYEDTIHTGTPLPCEGLSGGTSYGYEIVPYEVACPVPPCSPVEKSSIFGSYPISLVD